MDRGTFVEHAGRPAVRFQRTYPHPPAQVWSAITEPAGLAHWFPATVALVPRVGGSIEFSGDPYSDDRVGTVLAYDPPRRFAFTWGEDELIFDLAPTEAGGCVLTLINVLQASNAAARNAAGWSVCLAELDKHLAGDASGGPYSADSESWPEYYRAYVAAGLDSGAPIPGYSDEDSAS